MDGLGRSYGGRPGVDLSAVTGGSPAGHDGPASQLPCPVKASEHEAPDGADHELQRHADR